MENKYYSAKFMYAFYMHQHCFQLVAAPLFIFSIFVLEHADPSQLMHCLSFPFFVEFVSARNINKGSFSVHFSNIEVLE